MTPKSTLILYVDGSCIPNPGNGGWAALSNNGEIELGGTLGETTNNRAELIAVLETLRQVPYTHYIIRSDSLYTINSLTIWYSPFKQNIKNKDLIDSIIPLLKDQVVTLEWVKAHHVDRLNNEVDRLAKLFASR